MNATSTTSDRDRERGVKVPPVPSGVDVEVFYDGDCPLCQREIKMLQRLDKHGRIAFTDIAGENFRAADYGKSQSELMSEIHGRLPDGEWIKGVEVFRQLYGAVGWGAVVRVTRLPVIKQSLDLAYRLFAKQRLRLTGRCDKNGCQTSAGNPANREESGQAHYCSAQDLRSADSAK